jgi:hypothetical protein
MNTWKCSIYRTIPIALISALYFSFWESTFLQIFYGLCVFLCIIFSSKYFIFNHVLLILTHAAASKTVIMYLHIIDFCDLHQVSTHEKENVTSQFFPFIRKLTYDFTFPVHILRFHWDFFYFMRVLLKFAGKTHVIFLSCTSFYVWSLISIETTIHFKYVFNTD